MARGTILKQLGVFFLVWLGVTIVGTAPPLTDALAPLGLSDLATAAAGLLAAIVGVLVVERILRGPSLAALGFVRRPGWTTEFALGLALGPALFWTVLSVESWSGLARLGAGGLGLGGLLVALLTLLCVGAGEELVMRGVLLQQVGRGWGVRAGVVVSSLVFGLFHLPNVFVAEVEPAVGLIAVLVLVALGGVFAYATLLTRGLWLPAALHASWNFAQGPLLGFPISGQPSHGLVQPLVRGPAWVTGGAFGPEGGLVGILAVGLASAALWGYWRLGARSTPT